MLVSIYLWNTCAMCVHYGGQLIEFVVTNGESKHVNPMFDRIQRSTDVNKMFYTKHSTQQHRKSIKANTDPISNRVHSSLLHLGMILFPSANQEWRTDSKLAAVENQYRYGRI